MSHRLYVLFPAIVAIFLFSCDSDYLIESGESEIVVEGWIENDASPIVILTKTIPISETRIDFEDLLDYLVMGAKVRVSDGTDSVVLTGRYDDRYFPPYIYTTNRMRGETGKRYFLTVDYADYHVTGETMISETPMVNGYFVEKCPDSDTLFQINASFMDYPDERNYYQLFSIVGNDSEQYLASVMGSIDGSATGPEHYVQVLRGHYAQEADYTPYFKLYDTVRVKLARIDSVSYNYWYQFTKARTLFANMLFLCSSENLPTNLEGGIGYWCGYGAVNTTIIIKDEI